MAQAARGSRPKNADPPVDKISGERDQLLEDPEPIDYPAIDFLRQQLAELRPRIEELEAALENERASMRGLEGVVESERWSRRRAEDELKKERAHNQKLEKQIARVDRDKTRMAEKAAKELQSRENELAKSHEAKLNASHTELRSQVKLLELKLQNLTEELHDRDSEIRNLQRRQHQPLADRQVPEIILDEAGEEVIRLDDPDVSDHLYDLRKELEFERRARGATEAELDRVRDRAHRLEAEYKRLKEALPGQPKRRRR